jgi:hypothetical protein
MKFANENDDLIYFAQKAAKAKSPQSRLQALRQLKMLVHAAQVKAHQEIQQLRGNR